MPGESDKNLVIYERLYTFLHTLYYSPVLDREATTKLLDMYRANPVKTLALLNTLLFSNATNDKPDQLNPDLAAILQNEEVEVPMAYYAN